VGLHLDCEEVVESTWKKEVTNGSPMFILCEKIKVVCMALVQWNARVCGGPKEVLLEKLQCLENLKRANRDGHCGAQVREAEREVDMLLLSNEVYWRQQSKAMWLVANDKNTSYFHHFVNQRQQKNVIAGLLSEDGSWCTDPMGMGNIVGNYFNEIFTSSNPHRIEDSLAAVERRITPAMNQQLCAPYSALEVRQALFQMHPSKSPGLDGMSCLFFQKFWHIINEDVIGAVLSILHSGHVLHKINFMHVVLIPKINDPHNVSDYCPISLCNVIYKIISKVLANRLKGLLDSVISESQSAFVPGRLITDNVAVAFELLHGLKSKQTGKKGQMVVKRMTRWNGHF
jgi:hypothetical protein